MHTHRGGGLLIIALQSKLWPLEINGLTWHLCTHIHRLSWWRDFNVSTSIQPLTSIGWTELRLTDLHACLIVFFKANYEEVAQPVPVWGLPTASTTVAMLFLFCTVPALLSQCSNYRIWQFSLHYFVLLNFLLWKAFTGKHLLGI